MAFSVAGERKAILAMNPVRSDDKTGYLVDGKKLPSVTTVLQTVLGQPYLGPESAGIRGRYVHDATALMDGGRDGSGLDWATVPEEYLGYLRAWERFKAEAAFRTVLVEHIVWCDLPAYAGRLDRFGFIFDGTRDGCFALLDIKSGEDELAEYQTAAYLHGLREHRPETLDNLSAREWRSVRRCSVKVAKDGTYKVRWHENPSDLQVFFAALTLYPLLKGRGK